MAQRTGYSGNNVADEPDSALLPLTRYYTSTLSFHLHSAQLHSDMSDIDLAKVVGFKAPDRPVSLCGAAAVHASLQLSFLQVQWNKRDLLTYAVGIGAKSSDLEFVYGPSTLIFHENLPR